MSVMPVNLMVLLALVVPVVTKNFMKLLMPVVAGRPVIAVRSVVPMKLVEPMVAKTPVVVGRPVMYIFFISA